jgi:hypothetical protein
MNEMFPLSLAAFFVRAAQVLCCICFQFLAGINAAILAALQFLVALGFCAPLPRACQVLWKSSILAWEAGVELGAILWMAAFLVSAAAKFVMVGIHFLVPLCTRDIEIRVIAGTSVIFAEQWFTALLA